MTTTNDETIITIRAEPIELFKVLKLDGEVSGGGQAKTLIGEGAVQVNGETETRKRKKIFNGDTVSYLGRVLRVQLVSGEANGTAAQD